MDWAAALTQANEKEGFVRYLDSTYGDYLQEKIGRLVAKDARGGAQLQYMAYVNSDLIGVDKGELKKNPELAMRHSITRNLGEIAFKSYSSALRRGATKEEAVAYADNLIKSGLMEGMEKSPKELIQSLAGSDKTGDMFINYGGLRYETSLTGQDLGNSGMAFLEKMGDSSIVGRIIANATEGTFGLSQSLRGAAIIENLSGNDPMLSSTLQEVASWTGMAAGMLETMAVATIGSPFAVPTYIAAKGVSQNLTDSYGLRAKPTAGDLAVGAAFDFATTWIGAQIGNRIIDTAMATELAPSLSSVLKGITKTDIFNRYVAIGVASPFVNVAFDMAVDYGTAQIIHGAGIDLPQNTWDIYNNMSSTALRDAFFKRIMMQGGSALARNIKDTVYRKNVLADKGEVFGTMAYTNKEFGDIVKGAGGEETRSKVVFNIAKFFAGVGYKMSPGVLQNLDSLVRYNTNLRDPAADHGSLISAIHGFANGGGDESQRTDFRRAIIAGIMMNEMNKKEAIDSVFIGPFAWTRGLAMALGGVSRQDVEDAAQAYQYRNRKYTDVMTKVVEDIETNVRVRIDDSNIDQFEDLIADTLHGITTNYKSGAEDDTGRIAGDILDLISRTSIISTDSTMTRSNEDIARNIKLKLESRKASVNNDPNKIRDLDNAERIAEKIFTSKDEQVTRYENAQYSGNAGVETAKNTFMTSLHSALNQNGDRAFIPMGMIEGAKGIKEMLPRIESRVNAFIQESQENKRLANDPLTRWNTSIREYREATGIDKLVSDIEKTMMSVGGEDVPSVKTLNAYLHLKDIVLEAGRKSLVQYAKNIAAISNNKDLPEKVKGIEFHKAVMDYSVLLRTLGDTIDRAVQLDIESILHSGDVEYMKSSKNNAYDIFSKDSSAYDYIKDGMNTLVRLNNFNKSMFYHFADRIDDMINSVETVKDIVSRYQGTSKAPLDIITLHRMLSAISPSGVAREGIDPATGEFFKYTGRINDTEESYTDDDVVNMVGRVMSTYNMLGEGGKVRPENLDRLLRKSALVLANRVLDQELLKAFGNYTRLANIDSISDKDVLISKAVDETNKRLSALVGPGDKFSIDKNSLQLVTPGQTGSDAYDKLSIEFTVSQAKQKAVNKFFSGYLQTYAAPDDYKRGTDTRKGILENFLRKSKYKDNDPSIIVMSSSKKGGIFKSASLNDLEKEYSLFVSRGSRDIIQNIVAASMAYNQKNGSTTYQSYLEDLMHIAIADLKIDKMEFCSDVKRAVKHKLLQEQAWQNRSHIAVEAEVAKRTDAILWSVVGQKLAAASIDHRNGLENNVEVLRIAHSVDQYSQNNPGVVFRPQKFGPITLFTVSYENLTDEQKNSHDAALQKMGLSRGWPVGAMFENSYFYIPKLSSEDSDIRDMYANNFLDDIIRGHGTENDSADGKQTVFYKYDETNNTIEFKYLENAGDTAPQGWDTASILTYADMLKQDKIRNGFRKYLDRVNGQDKIEAATYSLLGRIYHSMRQAAPYAIKGVGDLGDNVKPFYDTTTQIQLTDEQQTRIAEANKRATEAIDKVIATIGTKLLGNATQSTPAPVPGQSGMDQLFGDLARTAAIWSDIKKGLAGDIMESSGPAKEAYMAMKNLFNTVMDINDPRLFARLQSGLGGYKQYIDTANMTAVDAERLDYLNTIAALVEKASGFKNGEYVHGENPVWDKFTDNPDSVPADIIRRELVLAAATGTRSFFGVSMEDAEKRIPSLTIGQTMTWGEAKYLRAKMINLYGNSWDKIIIDGQPKGEFGTGLDGTLEVPPEFVDMLSSTLSGYFGRGNKVVLTFGGSNFKCQIQVNPDIESMRLSIHNAKYLSPIAIRKLFSDQSKSGSAFGFTSNAAMAPRSANYVSLDGATMTRLIQSIALHSPQYNAVTTSAANRQSIINKATLPLQRPAFSAVAYLRRSDRSYPTGMAKANALGAIFRQGSDSENRSQYMQIGNQTSMHLVNSISVLNSALDKDTNSGTALFFGRTLGLDQNGNISGENAKYNIWNNHVVSDDNQKLAQDGLFTSVGLGIRNIYDMAADYAMRQGVAVPEPVKLALETVADAIKARTSNGKLVNLKADRFREVTTTLLDYLVEMGHVVKYKAPDIHGKDAEGRDTSEIVSSGGDLYFLNIERSGLDTPNHSGLVMLTEVRNIRNGHYFAGNDLYAYKQQADFDGDSAIWRPVDNKMADEFINGVSDNVGGITTDADRLAVLANYERKTRKEEALRMSTVLASEERFDPLSPQPAELQTLFGRIFGHLTNVLQPLMDVYEGTDLSHNTWSDTTKDLADKILGISKDTQLQITESALHVVMRRNKRNLFHRNYNDRMTLANLDANSIYCKDYFGGMSIINMYDSLGKVSGNKRLADMKVAVTYDPLSGTKYYMIGLDDKKASGAAVLGIVKAKRDSVQWVNDDATVAAIVEAIGRVEPSEGFRRSGLGSIDVSSNKDVTERLLSAGLDIVDMSRLNATNLRMIQGDMGMIYQASKMGTDAPKLLFQKFVYDHPRYQKKGGGFDSNRALADFSEALVKARIASNIEISSIDADGFKYAAEMAPDPGSEMPRITGIHISDMMKAIIDRTAAAVLTQKNEDGSDNRYYSAIKIANDIYDGKSSNWSDSEITDAIAVMRSIDRKYAPLQFRKALEAIDTTKSVAFMWKPLNESAYREIHFANAALIGVSDKHPFWSKELVQLEEMSQRLDRMMNIIENNYSGMTTAGRITNAAEAVKEAVVMKLNDTALRNNNPTATDLAQDIKSRVSRKWGGSQISDEDIDMVLRDLKLGISEDTTLEIESIVDPLNNMTWNAAGARMVAKQAKSLFKIAEQRDKLKTMRYLTVNGEKVSSEKLVSIMSATMAKADGRDQSVRQQIYSALLEGMHAKSAVATLLCAEGFSSKDSKTMSSTLGNKSSWFISSPEDLDTLSKLNFYTNKDGARIFNYSVIEPAAKRFLRSHGPFDAGATCL